MHKPNMMAHSIQTLVRIRCRYLTGPGIAAVIIAAVFIEPNSLIVTGRRGR